MAPPVPLPPASAEDAFAELCALLTPVDHGDGTFLAGPPAVHWGFPYGGLLVGQALAAASATVPTGMWVRSLHAYLVRAGAGDRAVNLEVHRGRDGRSSAWRTVEVIQAEYLLVRLEAMFATDGHGPSHQGPRPDVPGPEGLPNVGTELAAYDDTFRPWGPRSPFDLRYVTPPPRLSVPGEPAATQAWIGPGGPAPDDRALAAALLTYASDMCMLDSCLRPQGLWFGERASGFTLDHSIWFHAPARVDDWLLLDQCSPGLRDGRGLGQAQLYARDGELLATVAQLGSIRSHHRQQEDR